MVGVAQLSVAVAGPLVAAGKILAEQDIVKLAGDVVKVGAVVSVTVMVWVAVSKLPAASSTLQVTVVVPIGKEEGALLVTEATEQLSVVVGVPRTTPVAVQAEFVVAATFDGAVMVGFTLSVMVTVWVAVVLFPEPSVTVQVTVVLPKGKVVGALLVTEATEQLSAVIGVPRTTPIAVQAEFVVAVTFDGAVMLGLIVSSTITV